MGMVACLAEITTQQLDDFRDSPESRGNLLFAGKNGAGAVARLNLDKAWHGIHYLLTGQVWGGQGALAQAVLAGTEIGDDLGYGPPHYLTAAEVKDVHGALGAVQESTLRSRFNPESMEAMPIYPTIWMSEKEQALEYLLVYYRRLVGFYETAAANENARLLYIM